MFEDLGLHESLVRSTAALGFRAPTPIQAAAVPPALAGRDVLASAPTGTGKTAAFLLPLLQRLKDRPRGATRALILTPTRELAGQIEEQLRRLAAGSKLRGVTIVGGVPMNPQIRALRAGVDVVVATPGRLLDHLQQGTARLDAVEILVLDEADRMLDMGFLPAIRRILDELPERRQTLLFSATLPPPIVALTRTLLVDPVKVDLQPRTSAAAGIRQAVYTVAHDDKTSLLLELLGDDTVASALVFTRTKHRANRLARMLDRSGVACAPIHGDRTQAQRTRALAEFRSGRARVLVATDVASRGIDVEKLSHVINYDVPGCAEDYVHRIGRTARAEATGDAWTFVSPAEEAELRDIERALGRRLPRVAAGGLIAESASSDDGQLEHASREGNASAPRRERSAAGAHGPRGRSFGHDGASRGRGHAPGGRRHDRGYAHDDRGQDRVHAHPARSHDGSPARGGRPYEGGQAHGGRSHGGAPTWGRERSHGTPRDGAHAPRGARRSHGRPAHALANGAGHAGGAPGAPAGTGMHGRRFTPRGGARAGARGRRA